MTHLLSEELALRAAVTFDNANVLTAVHHKIAVRGVRRQCTTVTAAGLLVVALVLGAVTFGRHALQTTSAHGPGVVVSAAPAVVIAPDVLASSVTIIRHRLIDVPDISVDSTETGGIVARGPASARDRIAAAVDVTGQFAVRPVLTINSDIPVSTMLFTLPAQPSGSSKDEQTWHDAVMSAAKANALPCRHTFAAALPARPLVSCNRSGGSVAVLAQAIVSGPVQAEVVKDPTRQSAWVLSVTLNAVGQRSLSSYTANHAGSPIAFLIDNQTLSAPSINSAITTSTVTIHSDGSVNQLRQYAQALNQPLPASFTLTDVSDTH